jgi:cytochrome c-type biogenesis protein CcmE
MQRRRARLLGLMVAVAALAGYFALTLSPLENVPLSRFPGDLVALAHSQLRYIIGAL